MKVTKNRHTGRDKAYSIIANRWKDTCGRIEIANWAMPGCSPWKEVSGYLRGNYYKWKDTMLDAIRRAKETKPKGRSWEYKYLLAMTWYAFPGTPAYDNPAMQLFAKYRKKFWGRENPRVAAYLDFIWGNFDELGAGWLPVEYAKMLDEGE